MLSRFSKAFIVIILALLLLASFTMLHSPTKTYVNPWTGELFGEGGVEKDVQRPYPPGRQAPKDIKVPSDVSRGGVIMPKLGNETAKAELGRATWKFLHTMTLRYPEEPTPEERKALDDYFHLFSRLYPCGECATEFQALLKRFPPQTSSRRAASLWLCAVHNTVNERLHKPEFDCSKLSETYDCGCGDPDSTASSSTPSSTSPVATGLTPLGMVHDHMDLEVDPSKDKQTGAGLIRGGR